MQAALHYFTLVFTVVIFLYSVFILAHILSWLLIKKHTGPAKSGTKVSIIVAARNEEQNIEACIKCLLEQNYPVSLTEIIICDDHSEDKTKELAIKTFAGKANCRYLPLPKDITGKKNAISEAIKVSAGELIIQTDADCTMGKSWLATMVNTYNRTRLNMICGPVAIKEEKNFCERFQALELSGLSLLSGAGISLDVPLLSNAANIAYTRKVFDAVGGFEGTTHTPSGDDILLMFKINKKYPRSIDYIKDKNAIVYTYAQPNWSSFIGQRIRWASKGLSSKNLLNSSVSLVVFLANIFSFIGIICLFVSTPSTYNILESLVLKVMVDFLLLSFAAKFFSKGTLLFYYPLSAIIVMIYTSFVGIAANFKSYSWKGRNY